MQPWIKKETNEIIPISNPAIFSTFDSSSDLKLAGGFLADHVLLNAWLGGQQVDTGWRWAASGKMLGKIVVLMLYDFLSNVFRNDDCQVEVVQHCQ